MATKTKAANTLSGLSEGELIDELKQAKANYADAVQNLAEREAELRLAEARRLLGRARPDSDTAVSYREKLGRLEARVEELGSAA